MKAGRSASIILASIAIAGCKPAGNPLAEGLLMHACPLSMRMVDAHGALATQPVFGPEQVVSLDAAPKMYPGEIPAMFVTLDAAGEKSMWEHTKAAPRGGQIAAFCGDKEVERATIVAPFGNHFRIHGGKPKPGDP